MIKDRMNQLLDLGRYPLHDPVQVGPMVEQCRQHLKEFGLFNLPGLVRPEAISRIVDPLAERFAGEAFTHAREHNIYFTEDVPGLAADHPAGKLFWTSNQTLCADQLGPIPLPEIYEWQPLIDFLAAILGKENLFTMHDPLARINVMRYTEGEALNWHFDRSEFTTTLLLQEALQGGQFQYRTGLRSDHDPNYDAVGTFLAEDGSDAQILALSTGTLTVFLGRNTAHRISPVVGEQDRIVAVFSYYEHPGVAFTDEERLGFYGRI